VGSIICAVSARGSASSPACTASGPPA